MGANVELSDAGCQAPRLLRKRNKREHALGRRKPERFRDGTRPALRLPTTIDQALCLVPTITTISSTMSAASSRAGRYRRNNQ